MIRNLLVGIINSIYPNLYCDWSKMTNKELFNVIKEYFHAGN